MAFSEMDPSKYIDENNWAVTIFTKNVGHAELLVEAISGGRVYTSRVHLTGNGSSGSHTLGQDRVLTHTGVGQVIIKEIQPGTVRYLLKSETWIANSHKVQNLINEAYHDQIEPERTPFQFFGSTSLLVLTNYKSFRHVYSKVTGQANYQPHNCMSWAIHKLRLIDVYPKMNPLDLVIKATPLHLKA